MKHKLQCTHQYIRSRRENGRSRLFPHSFQLLDTVVVGIVVILLLKNAMTRPFDSLVNCFFLSVEINKLIKRYTPYVHNTFMCKCLFFVLVEMCGVYTVRGCTSEESKTYTGRAAAKHVVSKRRAKRMGTRWKPWALPLLFLIFISIFYAFSYAYVSHTSRCQVQRARILNSKHAKGLCQFGDRMIGILNLIPYGFSSARNNWPSRGKKPFVLSIRLSLWHVAICFILIAQFKMLKNICEIFHSAFSEMAHYIYIYQGL